MPVYSDLADQLGPKVSGCLAHVLHSSNELGELSQWQCHDESTISIVFHYYYCCYCSVEHITRFNAAPVSS